MSRPISTVRFLFVGVIATIFTACGGGSNLRVDPTDTIGNVTLATVESTKTGYAYPVYIYLPPSYANGTATYPVIYATDGDTSFPPEGRFVNFKKILQHRNIDAILVGIGGTERRDKDYVLPGAVAYHAFITQELIPFVESHFRADPKRRILSGISLGGSFVVTSLFLEATDGLFFSDYISAEGSFFLPTFVAQERKFSDIIGAKSIPATLILARGAATNKIQQQQFSVSNGSKSVPAAARLSRGFSQATNSAAVDALYRRMTNRHYSDLVLIETSFSTDHVETDNPSFSDAMARLFK